MFVPIEGGFQRKSDHSQKESRCQTKRSTSCGAENRFRGPLLNPGVPLRPRRDAPSLLLSGFSMELEARIWFAAAASLPPCHENETLRSRQNQRSASVNLPKHLAGAIPTFLRRGQFQEPDWKKKKRRNVELRPRRLQ